MLEITRRGVWNVGIHNTGKTQKVTLRSSKEIKTRDLSGFFFPLKRASAEAFPLERSSRILHSKRCYSALNYRILIPL